jgi:hypothetical protein
MTSIIPACVVTPAKRIFPAFLSAASPSRHSGASTCLRLVSECSWKTSIQSVLSAARLCSHEATMEAALPKFKHLVATTASLRRAPSPSARIASFRPPM